MKNMFFLFLLIAISCATPIPKNSEISIHFKGKQFERLNLVVYLPEKQSDGSTKKAVLMGKSQNGSDWKFAFPDSLYDHHMFCRLQIPTTTDAIEEGIGFKSVMGNDTLLAGEFCFSRNNSNTEAVFSSSPSFQILYAGPNNTAMYKTTKQHQFIVSRQSDTQLIASTEAMGKSYCLPNYLDTINYPIQINEYETLTKKYPDSHFLLKTLNTRLLEIHSKADIQRIFNCFSPESQKSYYGRLTSDFLASKNTKFDYSVFENSTLPVWNSDRSEPIVKDTAKYNLVIFSASWCGPCHALIPKLKKVNTELKDRLAMTYVSLDEESTVKYWKELMQKENIPWRSVLAKDCVEKIKEKYFARTIPHCILVYPGGKKAEILDVRLDKDYKKLTSLVE